MSRKQIVGLVVLVAIVLLVIVMMRGCRTDYEDPAPEGPPSGEVSYTEVTSAVSSFASPS